MEKLIAPTVQPINEVIDKVNTLKAKESEFLSRKHRSHKAAMKRRETDLAEKRHKQQRQEQQRWQEREEFLRAIFDIPAEEPSAPPKKSPAPRADPFAYVNQQTLAKLTTTVKRLERHRRKPRGYWPKDIDDVRKDIIKRLYPYWGFLKRKGSWGAKEQSTIEFCINHGNPDFLDYVVEELEKIKYKMAVEAAKLSPKQTAETEEKGEGSKIMIMERTSKENWEAIRSEYGISKKDFGKKINFVSDRFKRKIIFRDVEHAFVLASQGFSKPALILAGGVIEELLRLYLKHKNIKPTNNRFVDYVKTCEDNGLLKRGVSRLSDSIRDFRNLVHLETEETQRHTVSQATAKGAVSSIFTIANDFQ